MAGPTAPIRQTQTMEPPANQQSSSTQSLVLMPKTLGEQRTGAISSELSSRHAEVTARTTKNYSGDLVPPSTRSNILRSLKFFGYCFFLWNVVIFLYSLILP